MGAFALSHVPARARLAFRRASRRVVRPMASPVAVACLLVAPVVVAALFHVWSRTGAIRLGYELASASDHHRALVEENRALRTELATLKSPERLRLAAEKSGLFPPRPEQIIRIRSGTRAGP